MKKLRIFCVILCCMFSFSACGHMSDTSYVGAETVNALGTISDDFGGYVNTSVDGDKVDYSYTFCASGNTNSDKDKMLGDFDEVKDFVIDKGGYIENVYNDYTFYVIPQSDGHYYNSYSAGRNYMARGILNFTVQINPDDVEEVVAKLDELCNKNNLKVYEYTQKITNYESYKVVDSYEDTDSRDEVISEEDLNGRIKYADINVKLSYDVKRSGFSVFVNDIGYNWQEFWDSFGSVITECIVMALGVALMFVVIFFILFFEVELFYKMFKKCVYKFKKKHPEYYEPRCYRIIEDDGDNHIILEDRAVKEYTSKVKNEDKEDEEDEEDKD